jgi:hypothetical protein
MKSCPYSGCIVEVCEISYHECHHGKSLFVFCENATKAKACPEEKQ